MLVKDVNIAFSHLTKDMQNFQVSNRHTRSSRLLYQTGHTAPTYHGDEDVSSLDLPVLTSSSESAGGL